MVAPSSPLYSPIHMMNISIDSSLTKRSSNAVAPSILIAGVGPSSPICLRIPAGSRGISDGELIVCILPPVSSSCPLVLLSAQLFYHCTMIPDLRASPWQHWDLDDVNQSVAQSFSGFQVFTHGHPSTESYAQIRTTGTSGSWSRANYSIRPLIIAILRLSLTWVIIWPARLWLMMCTASWGSPSIWFFVETWRCI